MFTKLGGRLGLGPVFAYEWITASRRWQGYALRSLVILLLLVAVLVVWYTTSPRGGENQVRFMARLGQWLFLGVTGTQLTLVLLAAPAATAGAICVDRARGTMTHILATDLSNVEVVLGKLAARLVPVLGLVVFTLPMMELLTLLGGVDPGALLRDFVVTLGVAVLGCSLAMVLSLWLGKTHEALLVTYAVWCLWLLARPIIALLGSIIGWRWAAFPASADPFYLLLDPYWWASRTGWSDYLWFLAGSCSIAALMILIAVWRLRAVCTSENAPVARRRPSPAQRANISRLLHRPIPRSSPSLEGNPVLWREWKGSRPSRLTLAATVLYVILSLLLTIVGILWPGARSGPFINGFQVSIGLLLLSVSAATSLAEERVRGSLDILMSTPLPTGQIVLGKWLGSYRVVPLLAVLPWLLVAALAFETDSPWWASLLMVAYVFCAGAAVISIGLTVATWVSPLGRAVGIIVALHVLVSVGWVFLVVMIFGPQGEPLAMASPLFWAAEMTWEFSGQGTAPKVGWAICWIAVSAVVGAELLAATIRGFDRQIGRIADLNSRLGRLTTPIRIVTAVYASASAVFCLFSLGSELAPAISALQFVLGTFLLAGSASSALFDACGKGGSGSTVVSRLPAARILVIRWSRSARLISMVVFFPMLTLLCSEGLDLQLGRASFMLISFLLAFCVVAVSLGVGISVWCRNSGRAVLLTTLVWVGVNVAGIALATTFRDSPIVQGASLSAPFAGVALLSQEVISGNSTSPLLVWAAGWSAVFALTAGGLLGVALAILNRSQRRAAISDS
jgi:ABC-type transport system involved in multi-copper enzyme maturation permease subunit